MRTAHFFNKKGDIAKAKMGAFRPCHQYPYKGMTVPPTMRQVCFFMAKRGFFRKNDPRLTA